jgi:hypothetical protein
VPDFEQNGNSFAAERGYMMRLRQKREQPRTGVRSIPKKDVLTNELAIQHRARDALQKLIEHEMEIIATLDAFIGDASREAAGRSATMPR